MCEDDLLRLKHISHNLFIDENVLLQNKVTSIKPYKVHYFELIININAYFATTIRSSIFIVKDKTHNFLKRCC